ncbi:MAG: zf-TFIIB domain-containing protein [Planctomycetota bacterium]|nr:zf-TFIIB domain-containing protein [Planctomycetota bacterium]
MSPIEQSRQLDPTSKEGDGAKDEASEVAPEQRFDRALGQFIVAQGLVSEHHLNEYWTTEIHRSQRLSAALLQYQMIHTDTLKTVLEQFQSRYFTCSRCQVSMEGKRNHFPRCPSCQSQWFEDPGPLQRVIEDRSPPDDLIQLVEVTRPRPKKLHDDSALVDRSYNEYEEIDEKKSKISLRTVMWLACALICAVLFSASFLIGNVPLQELFLVAFSFAVLGVFLFGILIFFKYFAKLVGANMSYPMVFLGFLGSSVLMVVTTLLLQSIHPLFGLGLGMTMSLKVWSIVPDSESKEALGYSKASFIVGTLFAIPIGFLYAAGGLYQGLY